MKGEKQVALVPVDEPSELEIPGEVSMFERLAKDPTVTVEKLEKLIALQERVMRVQAKAAFDAAFSEMQGEIPVITEHGQILVSGQLRSKYARNEDIQEVIKPILAAHGFSIRFRNHEDGGKMKIVGILSHKQGHSEEDEFVTKADASGGKNDIQAIGSARSYGQRYTTLSLLNIATRGADDDGKRSAMPAQPAGFVEWWADMVAVADEGYPALEHAFKASKPVFRDYVMAHGKSEIEALKVKAKARTGAV